MGSEMCIRDRFNPVQFFSGNITINSANIGNAIAATWPADKRWLMATMGDELRDSGAIFMNPRIGTIVDPDTPGTASTAPISTTVGDARVRFVSIRIGAGVLYLGRTAGNAVIVGSSAISIDAVPLRLFAL